MAEVHVLELPGGLKLTVPEGQTVQHVYGIHCRMSVAEGICPDDQVALEPVRVRLGCGVTVGGHCKPCSKFWSLGPGERVSWDLDYDPHRGVPVTPAWASERGTDAPADAHPPAMIRG